MNSRRRSGAWANCSHPAKTPAVSSSPISSRRRSIRKELRAVQRGLDADIERLGTWLKIINIGLVPLLLTLVTLIALWHRRRKSP